MGEKSGWLRNRNKANVSETGQWGEEGKKVKLKRVILQVILQGKVIIWDFIPRE